MVPVTATRCAVRPVASVNVMRSLHTELSTECWILTRTDGPPVPVTELTCRNPTPPFADDAVLSIAVELLALDSAWRMWCDLPNSCANDDCISSSALPAPFLAVLIECLVSTPQMP